MSKAPPITELNMSALKSTLTVLKMLCSQINLHQATTTAVTIMPGSVTVYTISPWNNTQACGLRKDERNSLADGASCPISNTTSTPKQCNRGKRNPTTPDAKEDIPLAKEASSRGKGRYCCQRGKGFGYILSPECVHQLFRHFPQGHA
jgi:hypothetical protein